jgi:hypothetical protein
MNILRYDRDFLGLIRNSYNIERINRKLKLRVPESSR